MQLMVHVVQRVLSTHTQALAAPLPNRRSNARQGREGRRTSASRGRTLKRRAPTSGGEFRMPPSTARLATATGGASRPCSSACSRDSGSRSRVLCCCRAVSSDPSAQVGTSASLNALTASRLAVLGGRTGTGPRRRPARGPAGWRRRRACMVGRVGGGREVASGPRDCLPPCLFHICNVQVALRRELDLGCGLTTFLCVRLAPAGRQGPLLQVVAWLLQTCGVHAQPNSKPSPTSLHQPASQCV